MIDESLINNLYWFKAENGREAKPEEIREIMETLAINRAWIEEHVK